MGKDWFHNEARNVLICDMCLEGDDGEDSELKGEPASWDDAVMAAIRALFPANTADAIRESDAFGALAFRLQGYCASTGASPGDALAGIDGDERAFADRADNPAAFLASRIERD